MSALRRSLRIIALSALIFSLSSCFTGIEGTKKITLSKNDLKELAPTAEETLLKDVKPSEDSEWIAGRTFVVTDDKASLLVDPLLIVEGDMSLHRGDVLHFVERSTKIAPNGKRESSVLFSRGRDLFIYTQRDSEHPDKPIRSDEIPGLADMETIIKIREILQGKKLWTRTALWLDEEGKRFEGKRFEPVTITGVGVGTMVFPVKIEFVDSKGAPATLRMNYGEAGKDSRSFSTLFTLTDPRSKYPHISDANWENICRGVVVKGMTKEECRLAKGNPQDVNTGHDYSKEMLIWRYPDATVLYFEDGILVGINNF